MSGHQFTIQDLFCRVRNGLTVKNDASSGGLPITRIETISNGDIDLQRVGFSGISEGQKNDWFLENGDILFSHINSLSHIGKCAIYEGRPEKLIHGMNLLSFRPNAELLFPKYALYLLRSKKFKEQLAKSIKPAVNQASVSIADIQKIKMDIPPIEEQKRIAAILDKADSLRRKRAQAIALADDFLRAFYQEIVKKALEAGCKPKSLMDIFNFTTGKLDSNAAEDDGIYPFFTCAKETTAINTAAFDCEALLLAGNNANGDYSVKHFKGKFNAYQRTYVITMKNQENSYGFFRFALENQLKDLKRVSKGTNTKYLTLVLLAEQKLVEPPKTLQDLFECKYQKIEELKQKMLDANEQTKKLLSSLASTVS